jgi:hypothetical protein
MNVFAVIDNKVIEGEVEDTREMFKRTQYLVNGKWVWPVFETREGAEKQRQSNFEAEKRLGGRGK